MSLNVQNYLGFDNLQTALEEGNQLIKKIALIKFKYGHKRKLAINYLSALITTMNRRDINWHPKHKFYFTQCLKIISRAALYLGVGADFIQYIDEIWIPIQENAFVFTVKTPSWAIETYVYNILTIIANVDDSAKQEDVFLQVGSPILNILLLQPSFEVQIVMLVALVYILNKASDVNVTFINLLRKFPTQEKATRILVESYFKTLKASLAKSRQVVREMNECNINNKIYTLICTSVTINNTCIFPCDDDSNIFINFCLAHGSVSLLIRKDDLNMIFGQAHYVDDNIHEVLYIYFVWIETIFYYPHETNVSLTCIEIHFTNCQLLYYNDNNSLKKLRCTVSMNKKELYEFLKMLRHFRIANKLRSNNGSTRILTGISIRTTANNSSPDIINPSARSDDNRMLTMTPPDMETRFVIGKTINKPVDSYKRSSSLLTDEVSPKRRKILKTSLTASQAGSVVSTQSANQTPETRRRLTNHPCIVLPEQPEPASFVLNMSNTSQNSEVVPNISLDEVVSETVNNSENEGNIDSDNFEELSQSENLDIPISPNDSFGHRTNSDLQGIESPVNENGSANLDQEHSFGKTIVSLTPSNNSFTSNLEKQAQCSERVKTLAIENGSANLIEEQSSISSDRNIVSTMSNDSFSRSILKKQRSKSSVNKNRSTNIDKEQLNSPNDSLNHRQTRSETRKKFNKVSEVDINTTTENAEKYSLHSQQTLSQLSESRIIEIRSQDYSISSNSVDSSVVKTNAQPSNSSQVVSELLDKNASSVISNPDEKAQSAKSSQVNSKHSDENTELVVPNSDETQPPLSVASSLESLVSNNTLAEPEGQCGKYFSILSQNTNSDTQSSTENLIVNTNTQYIKTLYAELNILTENTATNIEDFIELLKKTMPVVLDTLQDYTKFWCEQNSEFKKRFEQEPEKFNHIRSKY